MEQKEIVWAEIPFSDYKEIKVRPAVVVSNSSYNSKTEDVVACPLTTNMQNTPYSVFVDSSNLESGKLAFPSRIRADKILYVKKNHILKVFGVLSNQKFDELTKQILMLVARKT